MVAVRTFGLTHIALAVRDVNRSSRFYQDVFGAIEVYREAAGGTVREQGEFVPGEPYLFAVDPDGYDVEIWYELPTSVDTTQQRT